MSYFEYRQVDPAFYKEYKIPVYLQRVLPQDKNARILDIGCGFGQTLLALKKLGYSNLKGIDILDAAVQECKLKGLDVDQIDDVRNYKANQGTYDFIIMSHVLEHIPKDDIISNLVAIKKLLSPEGDFCIMVPNAQSNTGAYWMYEDFTHTTLFTTGSIYYVLRAAGFTRVQFLDPKGVEKHSLPIKLIKLVLLKIYELKIEFWNKVTLSSYHRPSPKIFSFELRVRAKH